MPNEHSTQAAAIVEASVVETALSADAAAAAVLTPQMGAIVTFRGTIRDHDEGRSGVTGLDYTAHPEASSIMRRVVTEVAADHPDTRIYCSHRIGALDVGEYAIVVAVASAHRKAAFACCEAVVDAVKANVPIWKQQHFVEGDHTWVGLQ